MSSPPEATVIVVNFNRVNLLADCLRSLEAQTYQNFEVVVVDNGSVDDSVEVLGKQFPHVRVVRNAENRGFCAANNQGFKAANANKYFVLLNNDAVANPGWLEELVTTAEKFPRAGMVGSKIYVAGSERTIDKVGHLLYWDGQNRGQGAGEEDLGQYDQEDILWPDGCAALYRREMIEQSGGFDEDFFAYADDADLGLHGRLLGWEAKLAPRAVVWHHRGATLGKHNLRRIQLIERNRLWLVWKHFPLRLVLLNPIFFGLRFLAMAKAGIAGEGEAGHFGGFRAKLGLAAAILRANAEAWGGFTRMWSKRRELRRQGHWHAERFWDLLKKYRIRLGELSRQKA
ncbi:MAG: glycosyltransferase family 2 protein [Bryobacter sp.]|nr:glycosyltransferase family 2 protein [Bryobacter sp.]